MKKRKCIFLIVYLLIIPLSGFANQTTFSEDSLLLIKAFEYLNKDNTEGLLSIVSNSHKPYKMIKKTLGGFIRAFDVEIHNDTKYPDQVFFSCSILGAAEVTYNNTINKITNNDSKSSQRIYKIIPLKGSVKIITDPAGKRLIDISEEKDPFSLCLNIAYNGLMDAPIKPNDLLTTNDGFVNAITQVALIVRKSYENIVDNDKYFSDVFIPELTKVLSDFSKVLSAYNEYKNISTNSAKSTTIDKNTQNYQQKSSSNKTDSKKSDTVKKVKNIKINTRDIIYVIVLALIIGASGYCAYIFNKYNNRKNKLQSIREKSPSLQQIKSFTSSNQVHDKNLLKKYIDEFSKESSNSIQEKIVFGEYVREKAEASKSTRIGWSLAALGRLITQDCTPELFKNSIEKFEKEVIPLYNIDLSKYEKMRLDLINMQDAIKNNKDASFQKFSFQYQYESFQRLSEKLENGILVYAAEVGVLPFAFFMQVIADNQNKYDLFVRQGAIMGLIDFFMKYKDNAIIKSYFETIITARANMINADNQMSFFEVRAPKECTAKQYAAILKDVLHCANPTIQYCDTERLMRIAEKSIPGIMDLLINYPLRLIDPKNKETEGFYHFEPFRHAMWVNYTPPLNEGQVNKRYNEILDMTLPNSSGLNIRLFTDPYAAIPVMFHEYNHYMEDPNEASVFLKTYAFSLKFYRKYKKANPEKDYAFVALKKMLGKSINPKNFENLNKLILKYYGTPKSQEHAVNEAKDVLRQKNVMIKFFNDNETWCPEIKIPLLTDKEDKPNADLIKRIIIRYAQVPRTLTKEEFIWKRKTFKPLKSFNYREYRTAIYNMFLSAKTVEDNNNKIECYESWKSFKDWCIKNGYVTRYKGNKKIEIYDDDDADNMSGDHYSEMIKKLL